MLCEFYRSDGGGLGPRRSCNGQLLFCRHVTGVDEYYSDEYGALFPFYKCSREKKNSRTFTTYSTTDVGKPYGCKMLRPVCQRSLGANCLL